MGHLLYLMFRCDFDVMESMENLEELEGTKHSHCIEYKVMCIAAFHDLLSMMTCMAASYDTI